MKKKSNLPCFAPINLLSFCFFIQESTLRVVEDANVLMSVFLCVCVYEKEMGDRKCYEHHANASHKHRFNSSYMHLASF